MSKPDRMNNEVDNDDTDNCTRIANTSDDDYNLVQHPPGMRYMRYLNCSGARLVLTPKLVENLIQNSGTFPDD